MCGLSGIYSRRERVDRERLSAITECLRHRGPDGGAVWVSRDGRIGLGHRRLAIIDLSAEAYQPFQFARTTIAFNGEIYNFKELRAELGRAGYTFATSSDTEVLAAAYDRWHHDCVKHLAGMFAFAIADEDRGELFIARDRVGEKPLFYHADDTGFRFASELKVLLELPGTPRRVDLSALNAFLAFGYVPFDGSILAGVRKLPAAHAMSIDLSSGAIKTWRYWDLPAEDASLSTLTPEAAAEALEPLLGRAVREQLCADVPVGVLLSGGLDSSLVAALAMKYAPSPVTTFSVGFPGHGALDESPFARLVAQAIGSRHVELNVEPPPADLLARLARQYDEPLADPSMIPTYLLSQAVRRQVTVALGGDGGDELFGGYPSYSWLQKFERVKRRVPAPLRAAVSMMGRSLPTGVRGRNYLEGFGLELSDAFARTNIYFDAAMRRRLLRPVHGAAQIDWLLPERTRAGFGADADGAAARMRRIDFRTYLPDDLLVKVDRASMLTSLEVRSPFLDHRVCEFAFSLPGKLTVTEHERKIVLRALARRILPPEFDARRKQGFSIPLSSWMRGDFGRTLSDAALSLPSSVVDASVIRDLLAGAKRGLANSHRIFALSMLGLWWQTYGIQEP